MDMAAGELQTMLVALVEHLMSVSRHWEQTRKGPQHEQQHEEVQQSTLHGKEAERVDGRGSGSGRSVVGGGGHSGDNLQAPTALMEQPDNCLLGKPEGSQDTSEPSGTQNQDVTSLQPFSQFVSLPAAGDATQPPGRAEGPTAASQHADCALEHWGEAPMRRGGGPTVPQPSATCTSPPHRPAPDIRLPNLLDNVRPLPETATGVAAAAKSSDTSSSDDDSSDDEEHLGAWQRRRLASRHRLALVPAALDDCSCHCSSRSLALGGVSTQAQTVNAARATPAACVQSLRIERA